MNAERIAVCLIAGLPHCDSFSSIFIIQEKFRRIIVDSFAKKGYF